VVAAAVMRKESEEAEEAAIRPEVHQRAWLQKLLVEEVRTSIMAAHYIYRRGCRSFSWRRCAAL